MTRERAQLAGLNEAQRLQDRREAGLHLPAQQIGNITVAVRHVDELDAGQLVEQFAGHVGRGAGADRGVVDLAGIGLGVSDELRQRFAPAPPD